MIFYVKNTAVLDYTTTKPSEPSTLLRWLFGQTKIWHSEVPHATLFRFSSVDHERRMAMDKKSEHLGSDVVVMVQIVFSHFSSAWLGNQMASFRSLIPNQWRLHVACPFALKERIWSFQAGRISKKHSCYKYFVQLKLGEVSPQSFFLWRDSHWMASIQFVEWKSEKHRLISVKAESTKLLEKKTILIYFQLCHGSFKNLPPKSYI